jgi:hypothetical protein
MRGYGMPKHGWVPLVGLAAALAGGLGAAVQGRPQGPEITVYRSPT